MENRETEFLLCGPHQAGGGLCQKPLSGGPDSFVFKRPLSIISRYYWLCTRHSCRVPESTILKLSTVLYPGLCAVSREPAAVLGSELLWLAAVLWDAAQRDAPGDRDSGGAGEGERGYDHTERRQVGL
jgi:hypothetical protein